MGYSLFLIATIYCLIKIDSVHSFIFENSTLINECNTDELFYAQALSELPIDRLLFVKNTFDSDEKQLKLIEGEYKNDLNDTSASNDKVESRLGDDDLPNPQALTGDKRGDFAFEHEHVYAYEKKEKKDKLQKLFAITVTALSFLAFGGYLLCLIVQAIKSKAEIYMVTTTVAPETFFRRRRRRRRRRKPYNVPRVTRTRREIHNNYTTNDREEKFYSWPSNINVDDLYDMLINFSESYSKYNAHFEN